MKHLLSSSLLSFIILAFVGLSSVDAQTCYVTKTGTKYHYPTCSYLSKSAISMDLAKAKSKGYSSCSRCAPNSSSLSNTNDTPTALNLYSKLLPSKNIYDCATTTCSGTTQSGRSCRNKTKDCSGRCHHHRN